MDIGALDWVCGSIVANAGIVPVVTGKAVNGQTTVWSNSFKLAYSRNFGCVVLCQGNSPSIQIQLEESAFDLGTNGYSQGSSNIFYVVPDAYPDIFSNIQDNYWHLPPEGITPIPMMHGRFKINGLVGNGSTVTVAIGLFRQESGRFL